MGSVTVSDSCRTVQRTATSAPPGPRCEAFEEEEDEDQASEGLVTQYFPRISSPLFFAFFWVPKVFTGQKFPGRRQLPLTEANANQPNQARPSRPIKTKPNQTNPPRTGRIWAECLRSQQKRRRRRKRTARFGGTKKPGKRRPCLYNAFQVRMTYILCVYYNIYIYIYIC